MRPLIPCLPIEFLLDPPDLSLIQNDEEEKKLLNYSIVMGLVSSPSVRSMWTSNGVGAKTGRMRSEREEEEALLSEKRVFEEEEEAGRRMRAASVGETGDWIRSDSGI